jgi:hypothetical protein
LTSSPSTFTTPNNATAWTTIIGPVLPGQSNQIASLQFFVPLFPNFNATNGTPLFVNVQYSSGRPLYGVTITETNTITGASNTVTYSSTGSYQFSGLTNGTYNIQASRAGYQSAQQTSFSYSTVNTVAQNTVTIVLTQASATATPTIPVTVITMVSGFPTVTPSYTPPGTTGAHTGFWGPFYNLFNAMGATDDTLGLIMAAFIIGAFMILGGAASGWANGGTFNPMGMSAGGIFGMLLSIASGFIPLIYIIVLILWMAFQYFLIRG